MVVLRALGRGGRLLRPRATRWLPFRVSRQEAAMSLASPAATAVAPRFRLPPDCPPPVLEPVADATRGEVELDLVLRHAGARCLPVRYELAGAGGAPVVLVAGGISADRHVAASSTFAEAGWWDA